MLEIDRHITIRLSPESSLGKNKSSWSWVAVRNFWIFIKPYLSITSSQFCRTRDNRKKTVFEVEFCSSTCITLRSFSISYDESTRSKNTDSFTRISWSITSNTPQYVENSKYHNYYSNPLPRNWTFRLSYTCSISHKEKENIMVLVQLPLSRHKWLLFIRVCGCLPYLRHCSAGKLSQQAGHYKSLNPSL